MRERQRNHWTRSLLRLQGPTSRRIIVIRDDRGPVLPAPIHVGLGWTMVTYVDTGYPLHTLVRALRALGRMYDRNRKPSPTLVTVQPMEGSDHA